MHLAGLVLTACHGTPAPADGEPALPRDCPHACRPDDLDCTQFPYEQLPARCREICYLGACCELVNGVWSTRIVERSEMGGGAPARAAGGAGGKAPRGIDCAPPVDAGVDTPPDGAHDA